VNGLTVATTEFSCRQNYNLKSDSNDILEPSHHKTFTVSLYCISERVCGAATEVDEAKKTTEDDQTGHDAGEPPAADEAPTEAEVAQTDTAAEEKETVVETEGIVVQAINYFFQFI